MLKLYDIKDRQGFDRNDFRSWIVLVLFILQITSIHLPINIKLPFLKLKGKNFIFSLNYSTSPIIISILLLCTTSISPSSFLNGIIGNPKSIQPLSVLILIFSLAYICISLDHTGLFSYLALLVSKWCSSSIKLLFISFFLFTVVVGAIASNDVVILTLTPLICYISKALNMDPVPFLIAEFIAANSASMALYVGNPTNVVISMAYNVSFLKYSQLFSLPFLFATFIELIILLLIFWNKLPINEITINSNPKDLLFKPYSALFGSFILLICLITSTICSIWHIEVWITTLPFALLMAAWDIAIDLVGNKKVEDIQGIKLNNINNDIDTNNVNSSKFSNHYSKSMSIRSKSKINDTSSFKSLNIKYSFGNQLAINKDMKCSQDDYIEDKFKGEYVISKLSDLISYFPSFTSVIKNLPWSLLPFLLGMFVIVEAMHVQGFTLLLAEALILIPNNIYAFGFSIGILSTLFCALLNNLPASILLARTVTMIDFSDPIDRPIGVVAFMALIICCNLGANISLAGSLAGLMWKDILLRKEAYMGSFKLFKVCLIITPFTIVLSILTAIIETYIFPKNVFDVLF